MAIGTGQVSLADIQTEYGGTAPTALSEYYSNGNAPASGEIQIHADFNGTSAVANLSWSTAGADVYKWESAMGCGSKSSFLTMKGKINGFETGLCREYNGSSWSNGGYTGIPSSNGIGFGTQTAGAWAGGYRQYISNAITNCDEYNGSSWSTGGSLGTPRAYTSGGGPSQTTAMITGGSKYSPTVRLTTSEEYNGTSWSAGGNMSEDRATGGWVGDNTSGHLLMGAKDSGGAQSSAFEYNGSTWSTGGSGTTAVRYTAGWGSTSLGYIGGGWRSGTGYKVVQRYNGTAWASDADLPGNKYLHVYSTSSTTGTNGFLQAGYGNSGVETTAYKAS
jgi:hypothetical protein